MHVGVSDLIPVNVEFPQNTEEAISHSQAGLTTTLLPLILRSLLGIFAGVNTLTHSDMLGKDLFGD